MTNREIGHYINGEAFPGDRSRQQDVYNPATGDVSGQVALSTM